MIKRISMPPTAEEINGLKAGDIVSASGAVFTARDAAHKRFFEAIKKGEDLPIDIKASAIYYAGPCPAKNGFACGSCGPTTSARMNAYAPTLIDMGLKCVIGKGEISEKTIAAVKRNAAVYLAAIGGAGALYASRVVSSECVAYGDLLSEAVFRLVVEDFPLVVAVDPKGVSIYNK